MSEVLSLFDEPWAEAVRRLALKIKDMQRNPKCSADWNRKEREAWRVVNYQLALLLQDVPES